MSSNYGRRSTILSGQMAIFIAANVSFRVLQEEILKYDILFLVVSYLLGVKTKKLDPRPDWSPLGV